MRDGLRASYAGARRLRQPEPRCRHRRSSTRSPPIRPRQTTSSMSTDLPARDPKPLPFPDDLPEVLVSRLGCSASEGLYEHQAPGARGPARRAQRDPRDRHGEREVARVQDRGRRGGAHRRRRRPRCTCSRRRRSRATSCARCARSSCRRSERPSTTATRRRPSGR